MKIEFRAIITKMSEPKAVNENTTVQEFTVMKPGYINEFGEKKGTDLYLVISAYNKKVQEMKAFMEGMKVSITCYIQSQEYTTREGEIKYYPSFSLGEIQAIS